MSTQVLHGNACSEHVLGSRPVSRPADKCACNEHFSCLFREYVGWVYAYALRRLRFPEDAEDLVAEVFIAAWREVDRLPEDPVPWLLSVARRRLVDAWRVARRHERLLVRLHEETPSESMFDHPTLLDHRGQSPVLIALAQLEDRDREALILFYWDGLSGQEAAQALGLRWTTYLVCLHRARRRLLGGIRREVEVDLPFCPLSALPANWVRLTPLLTAAGSPERLGVGPAAE